MAGLSTRLIVRERARAHRRAVVEAKPGPDDERERLAVSGDVRVTRCDLRDSAEALRRSFVRIVQELRAGRLQQSSGSWGIGDGRIDRIEVVCENGDPERAAVPYRSGARSSDPRRRPSVRH